MVRLVRPGGCRAARGPALGPPRFVEETATAGVDLTYDGPLAFFVGGGVAVLDCDGDGRPDLYVAGGVNAGGAVPERQRRSAGRFGSRGPQPGDGPRRGQRRLSARHRRRRAWSTSRCCATARTSCCAGLGDCRFERANERWRFDGGDAADDGVQRDLGGRRRAPDPRLRELRRPGRATGDPHDLLRRQRARPAGRRRASATPPPRAADAGLLRAVDAVQRLGPVRPARPAGQQRPPLLHCDGEEQLWRIDAGRAAAPVHRRRRLGHASASRGWASPSQDLTGDGYPEVFLTSQGDNRLQTLTDGPAQPTYRDIGLKRGVIADRPFTGGDDAAVDRLASGVRGRQQRRVHRPVRLEGQRQRPARLRHEGPEQPAARPGRRDVRRGRRGGGHRRASTGRAAPRSSTSTSTACSTSSRSTSARRSGCGGTSASGDAASAGRRWATGSRSGSTQAGAEPRRDRRVARGPGRRRRRPARELTVGGGHVSGELGWIHVGLGSADRRRGPRPVARRRGRAVADGATADQFATSTAARPPSGPGRRPARRRTTDDDRRAAPRLAEIEPARLRRCPTRARAARRPSTPSGWSALRARMAERGYDRLVV